MTSRMLLERGKSPKDCFLTLRRLYLLTSRLYLASDCQRSSNSQKQQSSSAFDKASKLPKMKSFVFLASLWATFWAPFVVCEVSEEAQQLALKWAPMVWLHPEEKFFPASPEFIINNMEVNSDKTYSIEAFTTVARLASRRSFLLNLIIFCCLN